MYIPNSLQMEPRFKAHQFINENGFAALVSQSLESTHLPFLLAPEEGEFGTLYSHIARANIHWQNFDGQQVLVIFNGPHSYISPTWYASGPAVPTWNYAAVHVYGTCEILNEQQTLNVVNKTVEKYEPSLLKNNELMPEDYRQKLAKAIVGFKVSISKIDAKHKLGQQRNKEDQAGVFEGLKASDDHDSKGLARYMRHVGIGVGDNNLVPKLD